MSFKLKIIDERLYTVHLPPDLYAAIEGCKIKAN